LKIGSPETRVNSGLAGSPFGEARFTRGSGEVLRRALWRGYGRSMTELLFVATLQKAPPILCGGGDSASDASFTRGRLAVRSPPEVGARAFLTDKALPVSCVAPPLARPTLS